MSTVALVAITDYTNVTYTDSNERDATIRQVRWLVELICYVGLSTVFCLIGIPTNIINCAVFWRQGLTDRVNVCLFSLAFADCLYLIFSFIIFSVDTLIRFYDESLGEEMFLKIGVSLVGLLNGLRLTSGCIGAIIAFDRCVCVVWPLRAGRIITTRTMTALILTSFVFSQAYQVLPFTFAVDAKNINGQVHFIITRNQLYNDNKIIEILEVTLLGAAIPIAGFFVVLLSTIVTVVKLKLAITWRAKASSVTSDRQVALTSMIAIASCVYLVTMIPFVVREVSFWIADDCLTFVVCNDIFMAFTAFVYTCSQINSSIHFFIYFSRSLRFRMVFYSIFTKAKNKTSVENAS